MSVLLDAFDDAGLHDRETRSFLLDALENAEDIEWRDILEPFVSIVEPVLDALAVPGVIAKSQKALAKEVQEQEKRDALPWLTTVFLKSLSMDVLKAAGLYTFARCSRLCRAAKSITSQDDAWQRCAARLSARWSLEPWSKPAGGKDSWRELCFSINFPRCDGIYVGECSYKRWLRVGHHTDMRKNAQALNTYGGRGGNMEVVTYRRYVRFLPPDGGNSSARFALVLQDPCPRAIAEKILLDGVDLTAHVNPAKPEGDLEGSIQEACDADRVRKRIFVARYDVLADEDGKGRLNVKYSASDGEFRVIFSLSHGGVRLFADRLTWEHYEMEMNGDVSSFNLNRLPEWKGGGLADEDKDHFPDMYFRPSAFLEHML
eukprot:TRINITY_DN32370_c0_g1_i1.p1 TRINITY_DN32370_c0_g1~~TRINITY_DN32370_c0_g1_i1.p1  ORF type:complete len:374 (-),score=67.14 TRINITY_DN32370_c0_g1_i1:310-1431(-)